MFRRRKKKGSNIDISPPLGQGTGHSIDDPSLSRLAAMIAKTTRFTQMNPIPISSLSSDNMNFPGTSPAPISNSLPTGSLSDQSGGGTSGGSLGNKLSGSLSDRTIGSKTENLEARPVGKREEEREGEKEREVKGEKEVKEKEREVKGEGEGEKEKKEVKEEREVKDEKEAKTSNTMLRIKKEQEKGGLDWLKTMEHELDKYTIELGVENDGKEGEKKEKKGKSKIKSKGRFNIGSGKELENMSSAKRVGRKMPGWLSPRRRRRTSSNPRAGSKTGSNQRGGSKTGSNQRSGSKKNQKKWYNKGSKSLTSSKSSESTGMASSESSAENSSIKSIPLSPRYPNSRIKSSPPLPLGVHLQGEHSELKLSSPSDLSLGIGSVSLIGVGNVSLPTPNSPRFNNSGLVAEMKKRLSNPTSGKEILCGKKKVGNEGGAGGNEGGTGGKKEEILPEPIGHKLSIEAKKLILLPTQNKMAINDELKYEVWRTYCGNRMDSNCHCCLAKIKIEKWRCAMVLFNKNMNDIRLENLRPVCVECDKHIGQSDIYHHFIFGSEPSQQEYVPTSIAKLPFWTAIRGLREALNQHRAILRKLVDDQCLNEIEGEQLTSQLTSNDVSLEKKIELMISIEQYQKYIKRQLNSVDSK